MTFLFYQSIYLYDCNTTKGTRLHIFLLENLIFPSSVILLAYFSKPVMKIDCNEGSGIPSKCHVKCDSYNGLPKKEMQWKVPENISSEIWKILKNEEQPSDAGLVNISSTAYFNCSGGKVMVSCSVDGTNSDIIALCKYSIQTGQ